MAACACCTSTCACRPSTRAFSPALTRRLRSCCSTLASVSLRLFKSNSTCATATLALSARSSPASLSLANANCPSKPCRCAATSACVALFTPAFHSGSSSSASSSRKPSFLFSLSVRWATPATGSPDIQLLAARSLAASSLWRLPCARAGALSCHAAFRACFRLGVWPAGWANTLTASRASRASRAKPMKRVGKRIGKVSKSFSEVSQTSMNLCARRAADGLLARQVKRLTTAGVAVGHLGRSMLLAIAELNQLTLSAGKALWAAVTACTPT